MALVGFGRAGCGATKGWPEKAKRHSGTFKTQAGDILCPTILID
jgi:hypothetical protein